MKNCLGKGALNLKHGPKLRVLDYVTVWSKGRINYKLDFERGGQKEGLFSTPVLSLL